MRELGEYHLIACCLNDACRHRALIEVELSGGDQVPSFQRPIKCGKYGPC